jgi:hypothetical protein
MNVSLHLIYEGKGGHLLTAAEVHDPDLICLAAKRAIGEAKERAYQTGLIDEFAGSIQKEDAERLEKVLGLLIPELGKA